MHTRCDICPATNTCVQGDGPATRPVRVMTIGEAPGRDEDDGGRPFIGQAGREFNHNYLGLAYLDRDDIYVTNTVKCRPDLNRKPTPNEVKGCASHHIPHELANVQPEVVILMGATACSLIGGVDLETEHGIPRLGELFDWSGWIVPMYHPASGLHDTAMMTPMLEDWERLGPWLETGRWMWPTDEWEGRRDYGLIETKVEAEELFHRYIRKRSDGFKRHFYLAGGDTESHVGVPYSWQISLENGVARMMMLDNKDVCDSVSSWLFAGLACKDLEFVFHNAPADLPIFESQLKTSLDGLYRDTMQEAYHFGNLRQGLKSLARRLLGRSRLSWEETVTPWSKQVLGQWLSSGFVHAESHWRTETPRFHKKTGKPLKPHVTRSEAEKLLVELNGYMLNNHEYKIWDKLRERMPEAELARLVDEVGEVPSKGIAHCPMDVQIEYGCSDPDDTRQLALLFDRMRVEFIEGLNIQDEDRDAVRGR